ncbi:MAG: hypothetical protein AAF541_23655 [Pseudomonadota bacterium]
MTSQAIQDSFAPVFKDIRERSTVADSFIDRDLYRVYVATLWSNVVLSPEEVGLEEADIEDLHDIVVAEISDAIGAASLQEIFTFIASKDGERAMGEARLTQSHKDLLNYFSSMILDPEGHRKFMDQIREEQNKPSKRR